MSRNYIDNKEFLEALIKHREKTRIAIEEGKPTPRVSNYLGGCFMKIAENLINLRKFRNYRYTEEMKSDAVYYCLKYIANFNPDISKNPFAYFTQISYYAFIRRIQDEKKSLYKKFKAIENAELFEHASSSQGHDDTSYDNTLVHNDNTRENMVDFISKFEESIEKKKRKNVNSETGK